MNTNSNERIQHELEIFDSKPDTALTDIEVLSELLGRSIPSIYRDISDGRIPSPIKIGRSSRWPVGTVRKLLSEGIKNG